MLRAYTAKIKKREEGGGREQEKEGEEAEEEEKNTHLGKNGRKHICLVIVISKEENPAKWVLIVMIICR